MQDLSPRNPIVNQRLSALVSCLAAAQERDEGPFLACLPGLRAARTGLPALCGRAEGEMERFWAKHFLARRTVAFEDLEAFWYFDHYRALWISECALLGDTRIGRLIFLGSGPLPLTAILAAAEPFIGAILCVDSDGAACALSRALTQALGLERRIGIHHMSAQAFAYRSEDVVLCASLIQGKAELYERLFLRGVGRFLVRDAEGAYRFLYEPAPLPDPAQFEHRSKTLASAQRINTTRLFERQPMLGACIGLQQDAVDVLQAG